MKKVILPLLLALIGSGLNAQTIVTKSKTKTANGKATTTVIHKRGGVVREQVIDPGTNGQTVVEVQDGDLLINGEKMNYDRTGKYKVIVTNPASLPAPSPVATSGTRRAPAKLGVYAVDDKDAGALVQRVEPGSPADEANLKPGDIIVKLNNQLISNAGDLIAAMASYNRGDQVVIYFERYERPMNAMVMLGSPSSSGTTAVIDELGPEDAPSYSSSSTYTGELPRTHVYNDEQLTLPLDRPIGFRGVEVSRGVRLTNIRLGSAADRAGLRPGDILTRIDGLRIRHAEDIAHVLRRSEYPIQLEFLRHGDLYTTDLKD